MKQRTRQRQRALPGLGVAALLAAGTAALAASPARAEDCVIKVARIVPKTGPLAAVGQMTPWVDDNKMRYVKSVGGIKVGDKTCTISYKIYDSKSTVAGSSEAATRAILDDKADVVMPQGTPDTTNAPSDLCERYNVPCIAANTPVEAWLFGPDGKPKVYKNSYEFFFSVPDLVKSHLALIKALPNGFNGKIGVLYPSDADGVVFASLFGPAFKQEGWTLVDPGRFEEGLPDFSAIVNQFKRGRVEVVAGVLAPPDLQNYLQQAAQAGFKPRMYVIDKGTGYPGAMQAIGAPGMNVLGVNFWSPAFPGKSAYGGWTGQEFAARYEAENKPLYYTPTGGYEDASYDVLFAALQKAGATDRASIIKALAEIDVDTIVGHVKFNAQHYSVQPLGEAEWRVDEKTGRLVKDNVFNAVFPDVKITAPLRLYQK